LSLQSGMRLEEVAEILGHKDLKICSKHYARFSGSHLLDKVRECAPQLGLAAPPSHSQGLDKVISLSEGCRRVLEHCGAIFTPSHNLSPQPDSLRVFACHRC